MGNSVLQWLKVGMINLKIAKVGVFSHKLSRVCTKGENVARYAAYVPSNRNGNVVNQSDIPNMGLETLVINV